MELTGPIFISPLNAETNDKQLVKIMCLKKLTLSPKKEMLEVKQRKTSYTSIVRKLVN
jgi:hypothetical protein